jgi:hypothetical protein
LALAPVLFFFLGAIIPEIGGEEKRVDRMACCRNAWAGSMRQKG